MQPFTEASNAVTTDIDVSSPLEILSLLETCDQEVFNGYQDFPGLFHEDTINTIYRVAEQVSDVLKDPEHGSVIFSGCGTSGRLGFLVSRHFNERQARDGQPHIYDYLMAGGDKALFTSWEASEDDPNAGMEQLKLMTGGKTKVVYVGITCGLSAPYVAGQLDHCLNNPAIFVPVLLGFNPLPLARNVKIEGWDKTFLDVAKRLEGRVNSDQGFILNPIIGPEPITGSSRMKSGTATKLLLESILTTAHSLAAGTTPPWDVTSQLHSYRSVCEHVYRSKLAISRLLELAADSLARGGSIYYLGNDTLALMGLIDASECPPTYGASLDDVRGYVRGGYTTLANKDGDLSGLGRHFRISLEDFNNDIQISDNDTVIVLNKDDVIQFPVSKLKTNCKKALLTFTKLHVPTDGFDSVCHIDIPADVTACVSGADGAAAGVVRAGAGDVRELLLEMATKWCLNAVSTGAHVLKGKVYTNIMIDVKVSNSKLFHRAVGILEKLGNIPREVARISLLRSIYETDELTEEQTDAPVAQHIRIATPKDKVVPVALLSALLLCSIDVARRTLSAQPVIRAAIVHALRNQKST